MKLTIHNTIAHLSCHKGDMESNNKLKEPNNMKQRIIEMVNYVNLGCIKVSTSLNH
jgi:hypothetical protein